MDTENVIQNNYLVEESGAYNLMEVMFVFFLFPPFFPPQLAWLLSLFLPLPAILRSVQVFQPVSYSSMSMLCSFLQAFKS